MPHDTKTYKLPKRRAMLGQMAPTHKPPRLS
jgi:hypothetical protein